MKCTRLYSGKLNLFRHAHYLRRVTFELILTEKSLGSSVLRHLSTAASLLTLTYTELFRLILLGSCQLRHPYTISHCMKSLLIAFVNTIPEAKHLNLYICMQEILSYSEEKSRQSPCQLKEYLGYKWSLKIGQFFSAPKNRFRCLILHIQVGKFWLESKLIA